MADKYLKDLERAKDLFYSWKIHEAYLLLRRFFDRLPFSPKREHALYLSYFVRCLLELGKERELNFYRNQIEFLARKSRTPDLFYQLAEVYCLGPKKNISTAKSLLEKVIADPSAQALHTKAKIFLAYCFDLESSDTASCREIIHSIEEPQERSLRLSLEIWKIKILRDEGSLENAEEKMNRFLTMIDPKGDWYAYFSAQIIRSGIWLSLGKKEQAKKLLAEARQLAAESPFKTIKAQLDALEASFHEKPKQAELVCEQGIRAWHLSCGRKSIELKHQTSSAKIFELFSKKDWVDKEQLAKKILKKKYMPGTDDNKIHFQIHSLRKMMMELELGSDPICFEDGGYRMLPKIIIREGEL